MKLPDKIYDIIKWIVMTVLPALVIFLNTCLPIWGVSAEVTSVAVTSISALGLFLGSILGFSTAACKKENNNG